jgi:hypothetical protein
LESLSLGALRVRTTHAPARIAAQFLDDFARILRKSSLQIIDASNSSFRLP